MKKILLICVMWLCAVPTFAFSISLGNDDTLDIYAYLHTIGFYLAGTGRNIESAKSDFNYAVESSRVGIRYKNGGFFANIETNYAPDSGGGLGFRQFYGSYTFSNGLTVTAGRKTSLSGNAEFTDMFYADNALIGFGAISDARRALVLLNYAGVSVAVIDNTAEGTTPVGFKLDKVIPRIEAAYNVTVGPSAIKLFGSYAIFSLKNEKSYRTYDINAFAVGTNIQSSFGFLSLNFSLFYSMNGGMYNGVYYYSPTSKGIDALTPEFSVSNDKFANINSFGAGMEIGMHFTPVVTVFVGGGYQLNNSTAYLNNKQGYAAYINMPIKINKYMTIKPQIGYYNSVEGSVESGMLLSGAKIIFMF